MCQLQNKKIKKNIFQSLNLFDLFFRSNVFKRPTININLQFEVQLDGIGFTVNIVKSLFYKKLTELQLAEKCFSRVLLSNDKNSCTHFPRSFLSVAQRSGAGVGAAVGPSQPSWLQIHLSENMTF